MSYSPMGFGGLLEGVGNGVGHGYEASLQGMQNAACTSVQIQTSTETYPGQIIETDFNPEISSWKDYRARYIQNLKSQTPFVKGKKVAEDTEKDSRNIGFEYKWSMQNMYRVCSSCGNYNVVDAPNCSRCDQKFTQIKKGGYMQGIFADLREYIKTHRDTLYTVGILLLVDHYVFQGAFTDRIKSVMDNFLKRVEQPRVS